MDKLKKSIPYILIAILIFLNIRTQTMISDTRGELSNMHNWLSRIDNNIGRLQNEVYEQGNEKKLVNRFDYEFKESKDDMTNVDFILSLNRMETGSKVYLVYESSKPEMGYWEGELEIDNLPKEAKEKIELVSDGNMNFETSLLLDNRMTYSFKVIVEGEIASESDYLTTIEMFHENYPVPDLDVEFYQLRASGEIDYGIHMTYLKDIDTKVTEVMCKLMYKGKVVEEFDLLEAGEIEEFDRDVAFYRADETAQVQLKEDEKLDFEEITIEIEVNTDNDVTYKLKRQPF